MLRKIIEILKGAIKNMFPKNKLKQIVGQDVSLSQQMIEKIEKWDLMLIGKASWCVDGVESLRLEAEICKEFANISLSEMEINISNEKLSEIFNQAIKNLNEAFQDGLGLGSMIIKPLGKDKVEFINANNIIPIEYDAMGKLTKCAFIQVKDIGEDKYYRIETHYLTDNGLYISNKAYKGKDKEIGSQIPLNYIYEWKDLPEEVIYPAMKRVDFGYYRNPIPNRIDRSFTGVSIFDNAIENIKKADIQNARLDYEYESAERAVFADWTTIKTQTIKDEMTGRKRQLLSIPKGRKRLFVGVEKDDSLDTFNPEIRDMNFINGLNEYLRRIEFNCSLAYGDLSRNETVDKTATEIKVSKKRKYDMVNAIQKNLKTCLEDLCYGLAFYNGMLNSNFEFTCNFKDSILTDEEMERLQDRQDLAAGIMNPVEYRMKWYGEDEATARKNLPEPANEVIE